MSLASMVCDSWQSHPQVGSRWLIAVSGGPDSVALLRTAESVAAERGGAILCAHIDHGLRPDSAADALWVVDLCQRRGIPVRSVRLAIADGGHSAIEERARQARYAVLETMARDWGATAILTGHTADDHAETILHHLFRGTGLRGLTGIPAVRSLDDCLWLWRPLLAARRPEILDELQRLRQIFRIDDSNNSPVFTRNRIRNELIPWVERELNPQAVDVILRLSEQATEVQEWMREEAKHLLTRSLVSFTPRHVRLRIGPLREVNPVVAREMFVILWAQAGWPRQAMTRQHWQRLSQLGADQGPIAIQMPGDIDVRRRGELLVITLPSETSPAASGSPASRLVE